MHTKRKVSDDTKLHRATWRCAHCGRFIEYDEGFSDREDRDDECSSILMFCNEVHADTYHAGKLNAMERRILAACRPAERADWGDPGENR